MHVLLLLLQRKAAKDLGHKLAANCTPHRLRQQFGRVLLQLNQQHYFKISRYACSAAVVAAAVAAIYVAAVYVAAAAAAVSGTMNSCLTQ